MEEVFYTVKNIKFALKHFWNIKWSKYAHNHIYGPDCRFNENARVMVTDKDLQDGKSFCTPILHTYEYVKYKGKILESSNCIHVDNRSIALITGVNPNDLNLKIIPSQVEKIEKEWIKILLQNGNPKYIEYLHTFNNPIYEKLIKSYLNSKDCLISNE